MKTTALFVLLLLTPFSVAAPNTDEYSIEVYVPSSRRVMEPDIDGAQATQELIVMVGTKEYEMKAPVLKALFPDTKTRKFTVVGLIE